MYLTGDSCNLVRFFQIIISVESSAVIVSLLILLVASLFPSDVVQLETGVKAPPVQLIFNLAVSPNAKKFPAPLLKNSGGRRNGAEIFLPTERIKIQP